MMYIVEHIDDFTVVIYFEDDEATNMILEAHYRGIPLVGPYSVLDHSRHVPSGQDHLHIYKKNALLFALNRDGTAHDRSHGARIPNRVADTLRTKYPDWIIPDNNIIESAPKALNVTWLMEQVQARS